MGSRLIGKVRGGVFLVGLALAALSGSTAFATPSLLIDADSGQVLSEDQATANWYPASLTKLMTAYVALSAVRAGRLTMDTPMVMSARAARMPPSKMGFRPGVQVTLDNALKMLMVKSPNDVAVLIAEGVSGSIEAFADEMNAAARRLGLRESHFVNPNGLADSRQVSSARDMAMIARALLSEFPEENDIYGIGALQLGDTEHLRPNERTLGQRPQRLAFGERQPVGRPWQFLQLTLECGLHQRQVGQPIGHYRHQRLRRGNTNLRSIALRAEGHAFLHGGIASMTGILH